MLTSANGQTCALRFFYYMFGSQIGSLSVYVRYVDTTITPKTTALVIKGDQGQQWLRAVLTNSDQRPFQFVIEGQLGSGPLSDIAIDDISFSDGCRPYNRALPTTSPKSTTKGSHVTGIGGKTSPTPTPTDSNNLGHSNGSGKKSKGKHLNNNLLIMLIVIHYPLKAGPIAAGVLVPVLIIGAILGFLFYRRYKKREDEDRVGITSRVHYNNEDNSVSTSINTN